MKNFEGGINQTNPDNLKKKFESYLKDLPLSDEELKGSLLDVGAHTGEFVEYLRNKLGNKDAIGLEFQEHKISLDKKEWLIHGNGLQIPFEDNSFETVTAHNYLPMFIDEPETIQTAIKELLRVVKKGGRVMGNVPTLQIELGSIEELKINNIYDEQLEKQHKERVAGVEPMMKFLEGLKKEHEVSITGEEQNILVIKK